MSLRLPQQVAREGVQRGGAVAQRLAEVRRRAGSAVAAALTAWSMLAGVR
jgi:hypothetical protein